MCQSEQSSYPKTVGELKSAIESIFLPCGEFNMSYLSIGNVTIAAATYVNGRNVDLAMQSTIDDYWPNEQQAVAGAWENIKKIRYDPCHFLTKVQLEDGEKPRQLPTRVYWRRDPELTVHANGICTVIFRAVFI